MIRQELMASEWLRESLSLACVTSFDWNKIRSMALLIANVWSLSTSSLNHDYDRYHGRRSPDDTLY